MSKLFELGQVVSTPGAMEAVNTYEMLCALQRHARGDWGDIHPGDVGANEQSIKDGSRLLSVYQTEDGIKFWIITDGDDDNGHRHYTTVLLPSEY